jgi:hypothetical protein
MLLSSGELAIGTDKYFPAMNAYLSLLSTIWVQLLKQIFLAASGDFHFASVRHLQITAAALKISLNLI